VFAVVKGREAAELQSSACSHWNTHTKQRAGTVVIIWLPDAWVPRLRARVPSCLWSPNTSEPRC